MKPIGDARSCLKGTRVSISGKLSSRLHGTASPSSQPHPREASGPSAPLPLAPRSRLGGWQAVLRPKDGPHGAWLSSGRQVDPGEGDLSRQPLGAEGAQRGTLGWPSWGDSGWREGSPGRRALNVGCGFCLVFQNSRNFWNCRLILAGDRQSLQAYSPGVGELPTAGSKCCFANHIPRSPGVPRGYLGSPWRVWGPSPPLRTLPHLSAALGIGVPHGVSW